ncbi:hypothetical protein ACT7CZ_12130, partial [Bacillus cereus]
LRSVSGVTVFNQKVVGIFVVFAFIVKRFRVFRAPLQLYQKRNNAFLRFNEKNYLKCQGENKVSPWLFYFPFSNKNHWYNQRFMIFTYKKR